MDVSQQLLKGPAKVALAAMTALFVLAIVFYRERVLFADAAYIAFHIINDKSLCIGKNRYGAIATQIFPYLEQQFHLSLKAILIGYGISFNLFFLSVNACLVYVFKQYRLAILMGLYFFLFVSESFIWVSDIPQGISLMFLLYGVLMKMGEAKNKLVLLVFFVALCILTLFTHFVVAIPFIYLWIFLLVEKNNWPFSKRMTWLLSGLIVCIIVAKFCLSGGASGPEASQLYGVTHFSLQDIIDSFTKPVVAVFLYRCATNYWAGTVIFAVGVITLAMKKKTALAIWTLLSALGYIIIMGLTYGDMDGTTQLFHIESEWSCIGVIAAAPFVFTFLPKLRPSVAAGLVAGIFVIRLAYIISFLPPFTARINMTKEILSQMQKKGIKKLALYNDAQLISESKLYWGLPFESMMLSSMDGDRQQLTFLFVNRDDKGVLEVLKDPKVFYDAYSGLPCRKLNSEYFNVDSTKPYQVMTYSELLK